nr:hypothetical protein [Tanacetum cinerariifolium]
RRCGDDSGVVAALDGDSGEGGCHGVEVVTRWRWVDVEPAAVGQRRWCWLCSGGGEAAEWKVVTRWRWVDVEPCRGGAGGGEAAEWSRWRVGESGVGDRVDRSKMSILGFVGKRPTGKLSGIGVWPAVAGGRLWNAHFKCKAKRRQIRLDQKVAAYPNSDDSLD